MTKNKLTKIEFAKALKRGHGRALMHVEQHGLRGISALLLAACLKEPSYDKQLELSRAKWLFKMFCDDEKLPDFSAAILNALSVETELSDLQQLCEFAEFLAKNGDRKAHDLLREIVLNQPLPDGQYPYGTHELVGLDGVEAVVAIARRFGVLLLQKPPEIPVWLGSFFDDIPAAKRKVTKLAKTDTAINSFLQNQKRQKIDGAEKNSTKKSKAKYAGSDFEKKLTPEDFVDHFFAEISKEGNSFQTRMSNRRLARLASSESLNLLLDRLNDEKTESVIVRFLRAFSFIKLSKTHPVLWKLVESEDLQVRNATIDILANIQEHRVGELGRSKLRSENFTGADVHFIELLSENFRSQDDRLILSALKRTALTDDLAHGVGFAIDRMYEANGSLTSKGLLKWNYEHNPCTECRSRAVELMIKRRVITPEIAMECRYDSNEEIRELVQQIDFTY
jgi:hypothetical protein